MVITQQKGKIELVNQFKQDSLYDTDKKLTESIVLIMQSYLLHNCIPIPLWKGL